MMIKKGLKILSVTAIGLVLGLTVTSCKGHHELCPAYTQANVSLEINS